MADIPSTIEAVIWPEDVAEIYAELAEEDRRLAQLMWSEIKKTWPKEEAEWHPAKREE